MKRIKFIKKLQVGNTTFKVVYKPKDTGASFSWETKLLEVGTKNIKTDYHQFFTVLMHEIMEMWTVELYIRYTRPDTYNNYEFHFDHKDFSVLVEQASVSILEFIDIA